MTGSLAFGIFAVAAVLVGTQTNAGAAIVDVVARGQLLTDITLAGGVVQESAAELAAQAAAVVGRDVDTDAIALALMCRSEEGSAGQVTKVALCHVACNQADALGLSPLELVQFHTAGNRARHFGQQITGRVASDRDCYEDDLLAAETALDQRASGLDSTAGATNFVNRSAFGVQAGTGSFAAWDDEMAAEGKVGGTIPGTAKGLVFYWRGSVPDLAEALT